MDTRLGAPAPSQVFEDFVPRSELVPEADADILQIHLPDFRKEQLRVQVTKSGILKISGQRHKGGDRWLRFHKEFPISPNCNQNKITAKYERGILFVRQPKLPIPAEKQDNKLPAAEPLHPQPQKPAADEQLKAQEEPTKNTTEEQAKGEETEPKKEEAESTKGKASETAETKSATERSVEAKKSEDETTSTKNAAKTDLATMLRQPRKTLIVALVVLVVVGIGLYVNSMIRSSREAEE